MPLGDASLNALRTRSSVLISQLELKGLAPTVLSPLTKHVGHKWAPLKVFMLHNKARAIISTEQISIIILQIWMPFGVETSSPIRGFCFSLDKIFIIILWSFTMLILEHFLQWCNHICSWHKAQVLLLQAVRLCMHQEVKQDFKGHDIVKLFDMQK